GDESLARAGRECEQRALLASRNLLEHGADCGVLIVAARLAESIWGEQGARGGRVQIDVRRRLPLLAKLLGVRKLSDRLWGRREARSSNCRRRIDGRCWKRRRAR